MEAEKAEKFLGLTPEFLFGGRLAQLVELLIYTEKVRGSSPLAPTSIKLSGILPTDSAAQSAARQAQVRAKDFLGSNLFF